MFESLCEAYLRRLQVPTAGTELLLYRGELRWCYRGRILFEEE